MNTTPESQRFYKRSLACGAGILFLFLLVLIRLIYLQLVEYRFYSTLSNRNVISVIPVKPNRGLIYDRNGVLLAQNIPVYSLTLIPARVKDINDTLERLQNVVGLTPEDIKNFNRVKKQYYPYQAVPLKQQLTEAQADNFYVKQYEFPGVNIQTNTIRHYPLGDATSDVVGYVGRITAAELAQVDPTNYTATDEVGKAGIEAEDEVLLHGTLGSEEAEIDANGKIVRVLKVTPAVPGDNIYLTIDSKLQAYAVKLLGKNAGAVVAIQPATGQVLALATNPTYDPNVFESPMTNAQYQAIMNAPDHPLFNRAIRATYAPGSTVKPFIAFGALNDGVINTEDYIFDPGFFRVPGTKHIFKNWVHTGFGWVNVIKAIRVSCDTFFYQLAVVLGIDRLDQAYTQFGFGSLTGIDLPSEQTGIVPTPDWKMHHIGQEWYVGDTVVAGIGQGYVTVTPLQLAVATATMSERGLRFQPTVLLKLQQPSGMTTTMQPIIETPIVAKDPTTWETVIQAMQQVTSNANGGTAYPTFAGAPYTSAGKTGTAQVYDKSEDQNAAATAQQNKLLRLQNNHLFICFAPINNPQIAVAVVVEHIHGMSQRAVQITRQLIDFYMNELKQEQINNPNPSTNNTTPQLVLPAPQSAPPAPNPSTTAPLPSQQALPAPAGGSLISNRSMQSIKAKQPIKHGPNTTPAQLPQPALPQPSNDSSQMKKALQNDLSNELNKNKKKKETPAELQQQMETGIDSQVDMQSQTTGSTNANTNNQ